MFKTMRIFKYIKCGLPRISIILFFLGLSNSIVAQSTNDDPPVPTLVSVNTPTASLEIASTFKGLLPPRMTLLDREAIENPANGLFVYCTDCSPKGLYVFSDTWKYVNVNAQDATATVKGKAQLAGDLQNTAEAPQLKNEAITTAKLAAKSVTETKVDAGLGTDKRLLTTNTTDNLVWQPLPLSSRYTVTGPSNVEIRGNDNAAAEGFETPYYTSSVTLPRGVYMYVNGTEIAHATKTNASDVEATMIWIDVFAETGFVNTLTKAQIPNAIVSRFTPAGQVFIFEVLSSTATVKFNYRPATASSYQSAFKMSGAFSGTIYEMNSANTLASLSLINPTIDCNSNGISGTYVKNLNLSNTCTYSVTLSNPNSQALNLNFSASDIVLSGNSSGITALCLTPNIILSSGASKVVEYQLKGTPTASGAFTVTWNYLGMTCSKTANILEAGAIFTNLPFNKYLFSMQIASLNVQGVIDNASNKLTFDLVYSSATASSSYPAFTSNPILGTLGQDGDSNSFSYSYPGGTLNTSGGTIPITIVVDGDGTYNIKKQSVVNVEENIVTLPFSFESAGVAINNINLVSVGGIRDRMYNLKDNNGSYTHQMVYFPITGADGKQWLNNNLGADYSNSIHPSFSPFQQAIAINDPKAYGSLFQWGRLPDGHELMNQQLGAPFSSTTPGPFPTGNPPHALFFVNPSTSDVPWQAINSNTWGGANTRNPCPEGYRIPTQPELVALFTAASITNQATAFNSSLKFTSAGMRIGNGTFRRVGTDMFYWSATPHPTATTTLWNMLNGVNTDNTVPTFGGSCRCIKN